MGRLAFSDYVAVLACFLLQLPSGEMVPQASSSTRARSLELKCNDAEQIQLPVWKLCPNPLGQIFQPTAFRLDNTRSRKADPYG